MTENPGAEKKTSTIKASESPDVNGRSLDEAFKLVNDESNRLIGWSLLIIGGSLLALFNNEYIKLEGNYKMIYFLYILGWILLCISIYFGQLITRNYLASAFVIKDRLGAIETKINNRFKKQIDLFLSGVIVFAIWIIIFLLLWIFNCKMH